MLVPIRMLADEKALFVDRNETRSPMKLALIIDEISMSVNDLVMTSKLNRYPVSMNI